MGLDVNLREVEGQPDTISDQDAERRQQFIAMKREGADLPTIFTNRFNIFVGVETTKVIFAENVHEGDGNPIPPNWHTSLIFPTNVLLELAKAVPHLYANARGERMQLIAKAQAEQAAKDAIPGEKKPEEEGKPH